MFKSEILHELETKINKYSLSKQININLFQDKIVKYDNSLFGPSNDKIYLITDLNILFKLKRNFITDLIFNYRTPVYNHFYFMNYGEIEYYTKENLYLVKRRRNIIYNKKTKIKIDFYRKSISKSFIYYSNRTVFYKLYNISLIMYYDETLNQDNENLRNIDIEIFFKCRKNSIYISKTFFCDLTDDKVDYLYERYGPDFLVFDTKLFINNFKNYY